MSDPANPPPAADAGTTFEAQLAAAQRNATLTAQSVQGADTRADVDRSWIARRLILIYIFALAVVVLMLAIQAYTANNWTFASSQAADLLKTALLPIVTLVLGYYFGQAGKT